MVSPLTAAVMLFSGFWVCGLSPGPATFTDPSVIEYRLPWHGQLIVPSLTSLTGQPWWVQTAENALKVPAVGWVTTTDWLMTVPPPTGTSDFFVVNVPPPPVLPVPPVLPPLPPVEPEPEPGSPLLLHAASTAAAPVPAAPVSTARRVVSLIPFPPIRNTTGHLRIRRSGPVRFRRNARAALSGPRSAGRAQRAAPPP